MTAAVSAKVVKSTDKTRYKPSWIVTDPDTVFCTDDAKVYQGIPNPHETVQHSVGEYVNGMAHTNGIESFWSMLKRAH